MNYMLTALHQAIVAPAYRSYRSCIDPVGPARPLGALWALLAGLCAFGHGYPLTALELTT